MKKVTKTPSLQDLTTRLSRIEGQVRGIKQMLVDGRDCDEILIQVSAIINSLRGFSNTILKEHLSTKIADLFKNNDPDVVEELITLFGRLY